MFLFNLTLDFFKCAFRMPMHWVIWLFVLLGVNFIYPVFFIDFLEAQVVLGVMMLNATLITALFALKGFTRILGLGHVFWLGSVPWLLLRLDQVPPESGLYTFMLVVMVINSASLCIDIIDVVRYVRGERAQTV